SHAVGGEVAPVIDWGIRLSHNKSLLAVGGQVIDVAGDAPFLDPPVRGFDEAKIVDAGEGGERGDQTDVRPFRCFHRTNPPVVGGMDVANLEAGAVAGKAPGAK